MYWQDRERKEERVGDVFDDPAHDRILDSVIKKTLPKASDMGNLSHGPFGS